MTITDLRKLNIEDLKSRVLNLNNSIIDKTLAIHNNSLKDISSLRKAKIERAQIKTILNERQKHE